MSQPSITPFPNLPVSASAVGERDTFVDEFLIRSMMGDGRLAVRSRSVRPQPVTRERIVPKEEVVLGSWF